MGEDASRTPEEELFARVRAGDTGAFEELYRDHIDGARHLARILVGVDAAEELVAESFSRVLGQLSSGGGPTSSFRSYLHVTIRNGYRDGLRSQRESVASDQPWLFEQAETGEVTPEQAVEELDETVAVEALAALPESWRTVLWHVEVEGRKPAEVATLMDLKPRAVSSLAHRAREGLKRAYLDLHAGPEPAREQCRWVHSRMSQYARGDLSARAEQKFGAHLDGCASCQSAFLVVDRVNQKLAVHVLPIVLLAVPAAGKGLLWLAGGTAAGGAAAGASGAAASGASGAASGGASGGAAGGASGALAGVAGPATAVAAAVAVAAVAAFAAFGGDDRPDRAPSAARTSVAASQEDDAAERPAPTLATDPAPADPAPRADPTTAPAASPSSPAPSQAPGSDPPPKPTKTPQADDTPAAGPGAGPGAPATSPPTQAPTTQPKPSDCGGRQICAGPVTITVPDGDDPGLTVEVDLPGLPIKVGVGPDGVIVGTNP
ncbi:sigma-70 family RNA polymerase sigma factor [Nocardioides nitrophenolicus]|uniref:sigma-70 family RNA polymerase sigma factor n=1 Tax=Nocardioides nitrophenolicus TaxID=60489 RepID=UPI00195C67A9|nr:sigma-70 family RNA polymerase sigma factor [Nocardioides nitrophenolicus]MBM7516345.1 RNA polymerase sigma factor (sigma-70 family) [Nocardioides nitrophenolicus]